jgi:hypothetical protein
LLKLRQLRVAGVAPLAGPLKAAAEGAAGPLDVSAAIFVLFLRRIKFL